MASPERKIQFGGWSKRGWKDIRTQVKKELVEEKERPTKKRRNKKFCKSLKGPHNMVEIRRTERDWFGKEFWISSECSACGRKEFKIEKKAL